MTTAADVDGVELFAGAGGTSTGAASLGVTLLGIETDPAACATREAAGHPTLQASVLDVDPADWTDTEWLVGSPPCQTFSQAGKGSGRAQLPLVLRAVARMAAGEHPAEEIAATHDARTALVLEPLRWALAARPVRVMLEQVPSVIPVWQAMAAVLRDHGYRAWAGILTAEQYGVPQTRERAVLMARRDGRPVLPPTPTHRAYEARWPDGGRWGNPDDQLFDDGLLPWVSMAEALDWGMTSRPYPTIACSRTTGGPDMEKVGGSTSRAAIYAERDAGRWVLQTGANSMVTGRTGSRAGDGDVVPYERGIDRPAPTVDGKAGSAWRVNTGRDWKPGGTREDAQAFDPDDRPAPTVDGKGRWHVEIRRGGDRITEGFDPADQPAQAVTSRTDRWQVREAVADRLNDQTGTDVDLEWPADRPSTVVAGRELVPHPGANANRFNGRTKSRNDGIRLTFGEIAALQTFPPDYPWRGNDSEKFRQVGNAVPPLLARAILEALL